MANEIPVVPPDTRKVHLCLKRWRSSHARRVPISESLWAAAGELARAHGINHTAKALHLEYGKLKQWADAAAPSTLSSRQRTLEWLDSRHAGSLAVRTAPMASG